MAHQETTAAEEDTTHAHRSLVSRGLSSYLFIFLGRMCIHVGTEHEATALVKDWHRQLSSQRLVGHQLHMSDQHQQNRAFIHQQRNRSVVLKIKLLFSPS